MELGFKKQKVIWILLFLISIYLVLAYKNPFSVNSLIPNLEPYPDTLLYTLPAWNWAIGNGFVMSAENIIVNHTISMTYSYYLAPFMKLFNDVRGFYYANILSGVLTIIFFTSWLKNIFISSKYKNWLILFLGFLLVTNFYFFIGKLRKLIKKIFLLIL